MMAALYGSAEMLYLDQLPSQISVQSFLYTALHIMRDAYKKAEGFQNPDDMPRDTLVKTLNNEEVPFDQLITDWIPHIVNGIQLIRTYAPPFLEDSQDEHIVARIREIAKSALDSSRENKDVKPYHLQLAALVFGTEFGVRWAKETYASLTEMAHQKKFASSLWVAAMTFDCYKRHCSEIITPSNRR